MIAADALYCYDLSLAYGLYSTFHRILSLLGKSPSIPLAKLVHKLSLHIGIFRTAFFTGIRLGMKSSVHRVFVLPLTVRTHFEILHGGKRPVIGDILYYAIPGTAACAVGKGIAVPPVIFIQYFPFALMANCQIWGNKGFMLRPNGTLENGKIQRFICFLNFRQIQGFNGINYRSLWSFFHNIISKIIDNLRISYKLHQNTFAVVVNPASKAVFLCQSVYKGSKAHALHYSPDTYVPFFQRGSPLLCRYIAHTSSFIWLLRQRSTL